MKRRIEILLPILLLGGLLFAEMSPEVYRQLQQEAQEYFIIKVEKVHTPLWIFSRDKPVEVTARILQVLRSGKGAKEQDSIEIHYQSYKPKRGWVGPRPVPVLAKGEDYHAFLAWSDEDGYFVPAARGYSFDPPLPEFR